MSGEIVALTRLCISIESVLRFRERRLRVTDAFPQIGRPLNVSRDVVERQHLVDRVIEPGRDDAEPDEGGDFQARLEGRARRGGRAKLDGRVFGVGCFWHTMARWFWCL